MNLWDQYSSRNHQTELTSLMEPELLSNARPEETPNRISSGFVLTEVLLETFLDSDRCLLFFSSKLLEFPYLFFPFFVPSFNFIESDWLPTIECLNTYVLCIYVTVSRLTIKKVELIVALLDRSFANEKIFLCQVLPNGNLVFPPFRAEDYRQEVHAQVYSCLARSPAGSVHSRDVNVRAGK